MKYVIIGNSTAAVGCVEGIRSVDPIGQITIVASEKYHTYSRPLISYLLCGKTDMDKMKYRPDDFYESNRCSCLLGKTVTSVDTKKKVVHIKGGTKLEYDKLLIATGSSPFIPPMKGIENVKHKFTFMSLDDALSLEKSLKKTSKVLIIGAGLIGLKCAEGIYGRCGSITVVDMADRVMPSVLDSKSSEIVKNHIEEKGIKFMLSDSVDSFTDKKATLKSGKTVEFDIVVIAVGVRPNTEIAISCGAEVKRGIVTDSCSKTTVDDIYAAGDCAESHDITTDTDKVLALLPNAYLMGETAGVNMAGECKTFEKAIPMNSIGFFGLHIITAGSYDGDDYVVSQGQNYKKLVTKDGLLKGYILVGDVVKRAGIYTSMIRDEMKLDTVDFENLKDMPSLIGLAEGYRKLKLSAIKQEVE